MSKPELLSPAGNEGALRAAVQSGADAVYIGGPMFNARRSADNFSLDNIKRMASYCHLYGVDMHIAVNTLIKERELSSVVDYAYELNDAGADALIIQDIGAAELIHSAIPDMPLHASTQMTVTSLEGVKYLENMGFSRVVLARELSAEEIEYICRNTRMETEVFVHGAICMCYSGQCLMSSILGGRSGNRGCCAQPCRLPYSIVREGVCEKTKYVLSPKDMALVNDLRELERIGVTSLKIEGRMKRAEYVSAVTGIYRKYIDNPTPVTNADFAELTDAFSRSGFTDGYFKNVLGKNIMSHDNPSNISENKFSEQAIKRAEENANIRKIKVNIATQLHLNEPLTVTIYDNSGNYADASGSIRAEKAHNRVLEKDRLKEQLLKLGQTPFSAENVYIDCDSGIMLPIKEINAVRRCATEKLVRMRSSRSIGRKCSIDIQKKFTKKKFETTLTADVYCLEQAKAAIENGISMIYAPYDIAAEVKALDGKALVIAKMPDIFGAEKTDFEDILVSSFAAVRFYRGRNLYGNFRLNVFNSCTANHFKTLKCLTLSPELNIKEIADLLENSDIVSEIIGYGRLPLMIMKNCPLKAAGTCSNKSQIYTLRDRKNEEFPIICLKDCRASIINSKPIFMADKIDDLIKTGANYIRLMFTTETFTECAGIINEYRKALDGDKISTPRENTFTRGHYYRGVL